MLKPNFPLIDEKHRSLPMKSAAYSVSPESFANSFASPLPVYRPPQDLFSDLDEDDAGDDFPYEYPQDLFANPDDREAPCFRVVESSPDGFVHRLIPDKRDLEGQEQDIAIPASLIRKIERELRDNECDPCIVFEACRNLPRGSRGFETAYTNARIRAYVRQPRRPITPPMMRVANELGSLPSLPWNANEASSTYSHPLAVMHLGHLMHHFGLLVITLLAAQAWASWKISAFVDHLYVGGRGFHFSVCLLVMLSVDSYVWLSRRGGLSHRFHAPGIWLFVLAIVPGFAFYLLGMLEALE